MKKIVLLDNRYFTPKMAKNLIDKFTDNYTHFVLINFPVSDYSMVNVILIEDK